MRDCSMQEKSGAGSVMAWVAKAISALLRVASVPLRVASVPLHVASVPLGYLGYLGYGYRLRRFHRLLYWHRDCGELAAVGCAGAAAGSAGGSAAGDGVAGGGVAAGDGVAGGGSAGGGRNLWRSFYVVLAVSQQQVGVGGNTTRWVVTAASYCLFGVLRAPFYPLPFLVGRELVVSRPLVAVELYCTLPHRRCVCMEIARAAENAAAICWQAIGTEPSMNGDAAGTSGGASTSVAGWRLAVNHDRALEAQFLKKLRGYTT